MEMYIKSPNWRFTNSFGKGFCTKIMKGARVVCSELPPGDQRLPLIGKNDCELVIDGGFLSIKSQASGDKRLAFNQTWENSVFKLLNGGVIEFTSPPGNTAAIRFNGNPARVLIDGGAMYQTNALTWYTDNYGIRYANNDAAKPGFFAVTNSTIKGTRFNLCGTGGNVTFHNSDIDFYFSNHQYAGFSFYSSSGRNSLTISGTTSFKAKTLTWESVSKSDSFLLAGGTFDAPVSMAGANGVFTMTGGSGSGTISMSGASNTVVFTGGRWEHSAANQIKGVSNVFTIAESACVTGTCTVLSGTGARLVQDGGTAFGGIQLTGSGTRAHLKNGATRWAQHRTNGLQFGTGVADAVFVIEDATYENKGNFSGYYKGSGYAYTDVGCNYTNCPGSAIEFRGTHPKFIVSETTLWADGGVYVAMVLGSFSTGTSVSGPALGTEPLDNPVALRYILPANGYSEAPLQGTVSRDGGRPIALCGNARIEVDASGYSRPLKKTRIPLVTDVANFTVSGYIMLDIDALNRNNAAYLPEGSKLEYVPADKTVYLTFKSRAGLVLVFQ
jgi:hypothetical protein